MLTYTLLFVLILGFIHVAKFSFVFIALIVWSVARIFGYHIMLNHAIMGDLSE